MTKMAIWNIYRTLMLELGKEHYITLLDISSTKFVNYPGNCVLWIT